MKKTYRFSKLLGNYLKKNREMKLTILFFVLVLFNANAHTSYSQNTKVSLNVEKESIENVLDKIEDQSEFKFFYKTGEIDVTKKVSLTVYETPLKDVLSMMFKNSSITYNVVKNQIVLKRGNTQTLIKENKAQTSIVKGTITDSEGEPLPGASVIEKGTSTGTVSDFDGNFSMKLTTKNPILEVSFIGYKKKEIAVDGRTTINIQLEEDAASLDEVVLIGYGSAKKSDLTGAVSQVTAKSFKDQPMVRLEDALQGRAAGVTVAKSGGSPGAGVKIRIRGANSITGNNDPLVVIDGIIGGDLSSINPNDIASMDVLKDASATAIYGSRGSNGVIMISTKKGSGKLKVNFDHFTSFSKVPEFLDQLSVQDFARIENSRRQRVGSSDNFTAEEIDNLTGTNYQDEIFQTGVSKNTQLSVSGAKGGIRYFLSANYADQEGIVINTGFKRLALRANFEAKVNDKLKVNLNIFTNRSETKNDLDAFGRFQGSPILKAVTWDPTTPVYDANGNYNLRSIKGIGSLNDNPLFVLNESDFRRYNNRTSATLNLNYEIIDGLSYSLIAGGTQINNSTENYRVETGDDYLPDVAYVGANNVNYQLSNVISYQKEFDKHNIKATAVHEITASENRGNSYNANGMILPLGYYRANEFAPNSGQSINNTYTKNTIESYMLRAEYAYNDDLLLTATVRRDGSSIFINDKWGTYPSVAVAYNFDDEIEGLVNGLTGLKLRAGYGQVGNARLAPYSATGVYATNTYSYDGTTAETGYIIDRFTNEELSWETTTQLNGGLDFSFLSNKINLSVDVYKKTTADLLLDVPVSDTNGGLNGQLSIFKNVGEVENKGLDLTVSANIFDKGDFTWDSSFNISFMKNEVTKLYDGLTELDGTFNAPGGQARSVNMLVVGKPLAEFRGATFLGTWKNAEATQAAEYGLLPGDAKYLRNDDGEIVLGSIGNGTPTLQWGFNNTFSYKNWDLNMVWQGVHGFDVYNLVQAAIVGGAGDSRSFLAAEQVNQWTPTNETDIPAGTTFYNSSRYVEKGDFIRLSNLNVGYTFKEIKGIESLKLYAGGQNLLLLTDYSGYDPEHTSRSADNSGNVDVAAGINAGAYPNPRVYNIGVKATF